MEIHRGELEKGRCGAEGAPHIICPPPVNINGGGL